MYVYIHTYLHTFIHMCSLNIIHRNRVRVRGCKTSNYNVHAIEARPELRLRSGLCCDRVCVHIYIYIHWANNVEYAHKSNKSGTIGIIYLSQTAEVSVRCETVLNCLGLKAWPGRSTWSRCSFGGVPLTEHKEGSGCFEDLLLL